MFEFDEDIKIITTKNGDKVITMPEKNLIEIVNAIYNGIEYMKSKNLEATAERTYELWKTLIKKGDL